VDELSRFSFHWGQICRFKDRGPWRGAAEIVGPAAIIGFMAFWLVGAVGLAIAALFGRSAALLMLMALGALSLGVTITLVYYVWMLQCQVKVLLTLLNKKDRGAS